MLLEIGNKVEVAKIVKHLVIESWPVLFVYLMEVDYFN